MSKVPKISKASKLAKAEKAPKSKNAFGKAASKIIVKAQPMHRPKLTKITKSTNSQNSGQSTQDVSSSDVILAFEKNSKTPTTPLTMPRFLPLLPSTTTVLLPGRTITVKLRRKYARLAVEKAAQVDNKILFVTAFSNGKIPQKENFATVGVMAEIESRKAQNLTIIGLKRVKISGLQEIGGCFFANYSFKDDEFDCSESGIKLLMNQIRETAIQILKLIPTDTQKLKEHIESIDDPSLLMHLIADNLESSLVDKQLLLETVSVKDRALLVLERMHSALESLKLQAEVRSRIASKMSQDHRENILREHLKAIQDELGDSDTATKLRAKILTLPEAHNVRSGALEELTRLETVGKFSPEAGLIRNYLETIVSLPWQKTPSKDIDVLHASKILDRDHFGLEKVKNRIIEHLAVMKLRAQNKQGSIILLVGPPGVGKTSLGRSIASALGRPFVRASLGGVRDDAEIRGHRRTYIGSLPGQIMNGIKKAGQSNPVFLLDEIDKLTFGPQGDPSAALLEVLDPEQNHSFVDHYLDVPFDLSDVLFICTANQAMDIPEALKDRLEAIELSSYTLSDKRQIAQNYLIPAACSEHGLPEHSLNLTVELLDQLILKFTREAGVRDLKRKISALARNRALCLVKGEECPSYDLEVFHKILGREVFDPTVSEDELYPGVTTGLAYTPVGGDILFIESRMMPGSGKVTLTGRLGEVMKESAEIALSLIRSLLPDLGLDFTKTDFHIHVPSGGIPKDGPSAGIALFTALASLITKKRVSSKLAMTGEISLSGKVLPVGGIKEKLIAAHGSGITSVILCSKNKRDLEDLPKEVRTGLNVVFVDHVQELLLLTLDYKQTVNSWSAHPVMN